MKYLLLLEDFNRQKYIKYSREDIEDLFIDAIDFGCVPKHFNVFFIDGDSNSVVLHDQILKATINTLKSDNLYILYELYMSMPEFKGYRNVEAFSKIFNSILSLKSRFIDANCTIKAGNMIQIHLYNKVIMDKKSKDDYFKSSYNKGVDEYKSNYIKLFYFKLLRKFGKYGTRGNVPMVMKNYCETLTTKVGDYSYIIIKFSNVSHDLFDIDEIDELLEGNPEFELVGLLDSDDLSNLNIDLDKSEDFIRKYDATSSLTRKRNKTNNLSYLVFRYNDKSLTSNIKKEIKSSMQ